MFSSSTVEDIFVDYACCTCVSWKEVLSLIDDYYKVNSILDEHDTSTFENFILSKLLYSCITRLELTESMAHGDGGLHKLCIALMKMASTREAREEVEPSRKGGMQQSRVQLGFKLVQIRFGLTEVPNLKRPWTLHPVSK